MKLLLSALLASAALVGAANAGMAPEVTVCTAVLVPAYEANDTVNGVGQYVDANGHRWIGFKADGLPISSTVATTSTQVCTTEVDPG